MSAAAPAQFDRSSQNRRSMLAKIHVAKKQLAIAEDDYRQMLFDQTGQTSLTTCSEAQLQQMITKLKSIGFRPLPPRSKSKGRSAQHPVARKARALWISLHHLGVVRNPSEAALEAFAQRQLGCERLNWARQSDGYRLIEALKSMAERNGWRQTALEGEPKLSPLQLNQSLCEAIVDRLKAADAIPRDWTLDQAAFRLTGTDMRGTEDGFKVEDFARLAKALGAKLRELTNQEPET